MPEPPTFLYIAGLRISDLSASGRKEIQTFFLSRNPRTSYLSVCSSRVLVLRILKRETADAQDLCKQVEVLMAEPPVKAVTLKEWGSRTLNELDVPLLEVQTP